MTKKIHMKGDQHKEEAREHLIVTVEKEMKGGMNSDVTIVTIVTIAIIVRTVTEERTRERREETAGHPAKTDTVTVKMKIDPRS